MKKPKAPKEDEVTITYRCLGRERARGQWIESTRTIELDTRLQGREHLEVLLHEAIHCFQPYLVEETVELLGKHLSEILYADGYRKVDES